MNEIGDKIKGLMVVDNLS